MNPLGIVIIGRNEGERLHRCLNSVTNRGWAVVYVDSGSTDGSLEFARSVSAEVVELDLSRPFTAAREYASSRALVLGASGLPMNRATPGSSTAIA